MIAHQGGVYILAHQEANILAAARSPGSARDEALGVEKGGRKYSLSRSLGDAVCASESRNSVAAGSRRRPSFASQPREQDDRRRRRVLSLSSSLSLY